ncbi:IS21-like element helper ATPase IstB [Selenihalanaerobacter shriftii]|uniref:DNA replication protein DnaC n=1 Tax=Selenihalanaerobacter shriftii TaxID=142842 RepID=A0A1T4MLI9_9FIRM|nr:IS21-like element helper ATPase IstB [Selenihalanaerobacter shriftii]SJZ67803.1 DNA replication protein DnaC [Selenihalanaerobacter shriftii]
MDKKLVQETKDYIKALRLAGIRGDLIERVGEAYKDDQSYEEFLRDVFRKAYDVRKENSRKRRIKNAKFPYKKYLSDIIAEYLPDSAQEKLKELKTLKFINDNRNIIFSGNPGTGKTHLSIGLGIKACNEGYKVFFATVPQLINTLKETRSEKRLRSFEKKFEKYDLIILDELGYISFDKEGSELLFSFLSLRAERKSTIITSNLSFDRWNEIFNDPALTAAMVDRLTHKSYVLNMNGNSFRMKETKDWLEKSS